MKYGIEAPLYSSIGVGKNFMQSLLEMKTKRLASKNFLDLYYHLSLNSFGLPFDLPYDLESVRRYTLGLLLCA